MFNSLFEGQQKHIQDESEVKRLDIIEIEIEKELKKCRLVVDKEAENGQVGDSEDFNKRGELYKLAFDVAPLARQQDLTLLFDWIQPKEGERVIDVSAGTGFLSIPLTKITQSKTYAVDPSAIQLENLARKKGDLNIVNVVDSLSEDSCVEQMKEDIGNIDLVTSYGGIHHVLDEERDGVVVDRQKKMFENVSKMLKKGGRMIAGDVEDGSVLAKHFEGSVKDNCLTSHEEKWLSKERFESGLLDNTDLEIVRIDEVLVKWVFDSEREMSLFMKGLHAYDMSDKLVLEDLQQYLGYREYLGKYELNWPMLFFHLEKR